MLQHRMILCGAFILSGKKVMFFPILTPPFSCILFRLCYTEREEKNGRRAAGRSYPNEIRMDGSEF